MFPKYQLPDECLPVYCPFTGKRIKWKRSREGYDTRTGLPIMSSRKFHAKSLLYTWRINLDTGDLVVSLLSSGAPSERFKRHTDGRWIPLYPRSLAD
jgi:hypothetical protein